MNTKRETQNKSKVIIGIDPGKSGAIAVRSKGKIEIVDMPLTQDRSLNSVKIFHLLLEYRTEAEKDRSDIFCLIEKAQSMPNQGSTGVFTYGVGYGKLIAILEILSIPFEEIRPVKWKKEFSITKKKGEGKLKSKEKKALATKVALQLFPKCKDVFFSQRGKLFDGRVEALLISEYGVRKNR